MISGLDLVPVAGYAAGPEQVWQAAHQLTWASDDSQRLSNEGLGCTGSRTTLGHAVVTGLHLCHVAVPGCSQFRTYTGPSGLRAAKRPSAPFPPEFPS